MVFWWTAESMMNGLIWLGIDNGFGIAIRWGLNP
jgi:hypothetical protein